MFDDIIEYNKIFFNKNHSEIQTGRLVSDLFFILKNALYEREASVLQLS